jgi:hypothetical protein
MAQNPYYISPMGGYGPSIVQGIGGIAKGYREQQAEEQAAQAKQAMAIEAQSAFDSGDPNQVASLMIKYPDMRDTITAAAGHRDEATKANMAETIRASLANPARAPQIIQSRIDALRSVYGEDTNLDDSLEAALEAKDSPEQFLQSLEMIAPAYLNEQEWKAYSEKRKPAETEEAPAEQMAFESLLEGLSDEDKDKARRIKLRLEPGAIGSAAQTISGAGTAGAIGDSEAIIRERVKFGELKGASRGKAIDAGFARIGKITTNIRNLDRAIKAVEAGAGTGAIEKNFPSIRAASVELDQIQGELALDVIGAVTFGALSEGELNLAKQIALPTGLDGPQLIKHLQDRQAAQSKLRDYFQEQVDFLDQGGSVAGFLREKTRQATPQPGQQPTSSPEQQAVVRFDRTGKRIQ